MSRFGAQKDHEFASGFADSEMLWRHPGVDVKWTWFYCLRLRGEAGWALSYKPVTPLPDEVKPRACVKSWSERTQSKRKRELRTKASASPILNVWSKRVSLWRRLGLRELDRRARRKRSTASKASKRQTTLSSDPFSLTASSKTYSGDGKSGWESHG